MGNELYGINLDFSSKNFIFQNTFFDNKYHAIFTYWGIDNPKNTQWDSNFWDNCFGIFPKIIIGEIFFDYFAFFWINFDRNPASEPYDLPIIE